MISKERLIDAFGELIYAVALADGVIQPAETETLHRILSDHPWAKKIEWSFSYEQTKQTSLEEAYDKALQAFKDYGPAPEYQYLIELLQEMALAAEGIHRNEEKVMNSFREDLIAKFQEDLKIHELR
jgi:uncharacterized tellurite resistance protein B-like protein